MIFQELETKRGLMPVSNIPSITHKRPSINRIPLCTDGLSKHRLLADTDNTNPYLLPANNRPFPYYILL